MHFFGYGYSFIKWINLILNDLSSCINHCGNITNRFKVGRSCRQGDPISPYLFILCVEVLTLKIRQNKAVKGFKIGNWEHKLDMYADDLTCYLDGSESSLKSTIETLDAFQKISGLKINLGKCKAVWIGKKRFSQEKLCPNLKLIWSDSFSLLGLEFDSDLAKMDTNFRDKITVIEKLYKSWLYRKLTPLGKITVIKSMALSQLSHVVLVCPHLGEDKIKLVNQLSYQFLWNDKPDRMRRAEAVLPIKHGGLNMPDVKIFWESLKCSWARRIMNFGTAWHKILQANLLARGMEIQELLYNGPNEIKKAANNLTNKFWKETLDIFAKLSESITNLKPHYFFNLNIFDNEQLKYGENTIRKFEFPMLWSKNVVQIGDLFDCSVAPPRLLDRQELNSKYSLRLDFLSFLKLKTSVQTAAQKLGTSIFSPSISDTALPRLPLLFKISLEQAKGCRTYYQVLKSESNQLRGTLRGEEKWHEKLGTVFSNTFWDKIYKISQNLLIPNKQIWTQIQINKYLLPTNYSVNIYDKKVSPQCSFCAQHLENLHLLMWRCEVVQQFWQMISNCISNFFPTFVLNRKEAIFGHVGSNGDSPINTILALARYYIYQQKFTTKELDEVRFILFVKDHLEIIYEIKKSKNRQKKFLDEWGDILEYFGVMK